MEYRDDNVNKLRAAIKETQINLRRSVRADRDVKINRSGWEERDRLQLRRRSRIFDIKAYD